MKAYNYLFLLIFSPLILVAQSKKEEIVILNNRIDSLTTAFNLEKRSLQEELNKTKEDFKTEKNKLQDEAKTLTNNLNQTKTELDKLKQSLALVESQSNQLNESIKAYEAEIKTLEETNALIQMKNIQLEKEKQNRIECEEREETNTEDVESPKLISICTFRNIKIRTESVANLRNGAYTSSYEYFKNNQSINPSEIFNSKIIELESLLNKKFKSEFLTLSKDPNSEGCLDYTLYENVTFDGEVTNDFRYNNIDIDFSNGSNTIIFSRSFGLPGACQSLDIASVEFSIAELEPYFAE
jgi:hypothetical protein